MGEQEREEFHASMSKRVEVFMKLAPAARQEYAAKLSPAEQSNVLKAQVLMMQRAQKAHAHAQQANPSPGRDLNHAMQVAQRMAVEKAMAARLGGAAEAVGAPAAASASAPAAADASGGAAAPAPSAGP